MKLGLHRVAKLLVLKKRDDLCATCCSSQERSHCLGSWAGQQDGQFFYHQPREPLGLLSEQNGVNFAMPCPCRLQAAGDRRLSGPLPFYSCQVPRNGLVAPSATNPIHTNFQFWSLVPKWTCQLEAWDIVRAERAQPYSFQRALEEAPVRLKADRDSAGTRVSKSPVFEDQQAFRNLAYSPVLTDQRTPIGGTPKAFNSREALASSAFLLWRRGSSTYVRIRTG